MEFVYNMYVVFYDYNPRTLSLSPSRSDKDPPFLPSAKKNLLVICALNYRVAQANPTV